MTKKTKILLPLRTQVWNKFIGVKIGQTTCRYCNTNKITQLNFECGHLTSEANGGKTVLENLRPVCNMCNKSYGRKQMPDLYKWRFCGC